MYRPTVRYPTTLVVAAILLSCGDSTPKENLPLVFTLSELRQIEINALVFETAGGLPPGVGKDALEERLRSRLVDEGVTVLGSGSGLFKPSVSVVVSSRPIGAEGQIDAYLLHMQLRFEEMATIDRTSRWQGVKTHVEDAFGFAPVDSAEVATEVLLDQVLDQFFNTLRLAEAIWEGQNGPK